MKAFSLLCFVIGIGYPLAFLHMRRLERKLLKKRDCNKSKSRFC